jgi:hypothetical protein
LTLVLLSRRFAWREALTVVKPETFIRWHREGFRLFWRWRSKPRGRQPVPPDLQRLIAKWPRPTCLGVRSVSPVNCC